MKSIDPYSLPNDQPEDPVAPPPTEDERDVTIAGWRSPYFVKQAGYPMPAPKPPKPKE